MLHVMWVLPPNFLLHFPHNAKIDIVNRMKFSIFYCFFLYGEGRPRLDLEYPVYGACELAVEGAAIFYCVANCHLFGMIKNLHFRYLLAILYRNKHLTRLIKSPMSDKLRVIHSIWNCYPISTNNSNNLSSNRVYCASKSNFLIKNVSNN